MVDVTRCSECGTRLRPGETVDGLCPGCLLIVAAPESPARTGQLRWEPDESIERRQIATTLDVGARLGPYEILSPLGAGGMAEVYRAWDHRLGRSVAIKVLRHGAGDPDLRRRLEREARIVARLSHPNICPVHDVGEQDGALFVVMECLEGETMAERLRRGPLPVEEALRCAIQIVDALDAAHRQGVTHRDLKPANVMLTKAGARLLDFGLAKLEPPEPLPLWAYAADAAAFDDGSVVGTVQYMAPEQIEGRDVDARTDLYAFGLVLYEALTGRRAFDGGSQIDVAAAILSLAPPSISGVPAAIDRVIRVCLAKNPEDRWQSAHDLGLQLRWLADSRPDGIASRPFGGATARRRVAWMAGTLAVAAVTVLLVGSSAGRREDRGVLRFTVVPPQSPGSPGGDSGFAWISPDGRRLAWLVVSEGKTSLAVQELDSFRPVWLAETQSARYPFWSPDSRTIAFFSGASLKKVAASGGPVETIAAAPFGHGGTWNRQGEIVFAPDATGVLYRVPASGGTPVPVTRLDDAAGETSHQWPAFLPDGTHVVYFATGGANARRGAYVVDLASGNQRWLTSTESPAVYTPGYLLFTRGSSLLAMPFNAKRGEPAGDPFVVDGQVFVSPSPARAYFSASENGRLVYHSRTIVPGELTWVNRDGRRLGSISPAEAYRDALLSPDGRRLAAYRLEQGDVTARVWLIDLERGTRSLLTTGVLQSENPVWSPDGAELVFSSNVDGRGKLFRISANGGRPQQMLDVIGLVAANDWSPDGTRVLFERTDATMRNDLWTISVGENEQAAPYLQTSFDEIQGRFSPDGRWVAYASDESGRYEVYVQPFPPTGSRVQISTAGGSQPMWRGDGRELFYVSRDRQVMSVPISRGAALGAAAPEPLFTFPGSEILGSRNSYAVTSDGQRFVVNVPAEPPRARMLAMVVDNWLASSMAGAGAPADGKGGR